MSTDAITSLSPERERGELAHEPATAATALIEAPQKPELSLQRFFIRGLSNLALATIVERALGFAANLVAARVAGPLTFGAYSVVMSTANLFSTYGSAGIGSTANRFGGEYPVQSAAHIKLIRHLLIVSCISILFATALMFFTAPLLATAVLKAPQLEILLRWAALSTGLAIMVACFRGLFIGEGNFKSLLAVCSIAALGLAVLLPLAAYIGLVAMIKAQIAASMPAVAISAIIVWRLVRRSRGNSAIGDDGPKLSTIAGFGLAQLGATAGISVASWWVSVLLIRNDSSFRQMGFYAISNQVRGLLAIGPTIVGQIIYSALTKEGGKKFGGPQRVTAAATYFNTVLVLVLLMCLLPTITRLIALFYGTRYSGCELVVTLSLATVIVHMCGVPAALRLSVVSISTLTALNVVWTIAVAVLAYTLIPSYGAAGAAGAYLIAHTCSQLFAAVGLWRTGEANADFLKLSILIAGTAIGIGAIACIQYAHPHLTVALHVASVLLPGVVIATIMRRADVRACLSFARFDYARSSVS